MGDIGDGGSDYSGASLKYIVRYGYRTGSREGMTTLFEGLKFPCT